MSYDESDAAYDAYMDELLKEFRGTEGQQIADDAITWSVVRARSWQVRCG